MNKNREKISKKYQKERWVNKSLGEVATEIYSGKEIRRKQIGTGNYPAITRKEILDSKLDIEERIVFVDPDLIEEKKYCEYGDILLIGISGDLENLGKCCVYSGKEKCLVGEGVIVIKHKQNPKFLYHYLSTSKFLEELREIAEYKTVISVSSNKLSKINIDLPPLEIQNEIVAFLDKFTNDFECDFKKIEDNGRNQFECYKNFQFKNGIEKSNWELKKLEDIATEIISGNEITRDQLNTGNYPAVKFADISISLPHQFEECISFVNPDLIENKKYAEKGDILISKIGIKREDVGKVCIYLGEEKCLIGNNIAIIRSKGNAKFFAYFLSSSNSREQIEGFVQKNKIIFNLPIEKIKQIKVPVPSLEEQNEMVKMLDKIYKMANEIKEGAPVLIKKNKELYDCYKELLLEK